MDKFWKEYGKDVLAAVDQAVAQADATQSRANFGELTISNVRYMKFVEDAGGWGVEDIELEEYQSLSRSTGMEVTFTVNIQEFNPSLDWNYERRVRVGDADWRKTFASSVEAVFGKGSMSKANRNKTLGELVGVYVETHDVPQQPRKNDGHINQETGEPYRTISIARVFEDREACYAAYVERFGEPGERAESTVPGVPDGYNAKDWAEAQEDIKVDVRAMLEDDKGKGAAIKKMMGDYDIARVYAKAIVESVEEEIPL